MGLDALLSIVLSVFGLIGLGYALLASAILREETAEALGGFVFTIAIPLLLFRTLGTFDLPDVPPVPLWTAYFLGVAANIAIGIAATRRLFGRDAQAGVIGGMSASYGNLVMVGIPVVDQAFGEEGLLLALVVIAIHLPVMMTVSAVLIEVADQRDGADGVRIGAALKRTARSLLRNPIILGIAAGLAYRATGLPLEGVPGTIVDRVADTAIPLALIAMGMSLHKYGLKGNVAPAVILGVAKLLVMPLVVFLAARYLLALQPLATAVATVSAACPTGVNAYLMASRFRTGHALSANTITLTTAVSMVTFTVWLALFTG
jgi:predicted permease